MRPSGSYNLRVGGEKATVERSPRVGLAHHRSGIPVFLLYLRGIERVQRYTLHSIEALDQQASACLEIDRRAWQSLATFFLTGGSCAQVVATPIPPTPHLMDLIGEDRGLLRRTGIYSLSALCDHADLVAAPQANDLLGEEQAALFYSKLCEYTMGLDHYFVLVDPPKQATAEQVREWSNGFMCPDAALFFPWLLHHDTQVLPPSPLAAAAFQINDVENGLHDLPANRDLTVPALLPLFRLNPEELRALGDHRVNALVWWPGDHLRIWGGRTLADRPDHDARFISTRRLTRAVREAIQELCEPFVMEPATDESARVMEVSLQSFFQERRRIFHPDLKEPYRVSVQRREAKGTAEVIEVAFQFSVPYVLHQMSLNLSITG